MSNSPNNHATELTSRVWSAEWSISRWTDDIRVAYQPLYAETFAAESRRRISLLPELDWELVSEAQTALAEVSGGRIVGTLAPVAVHGERLAVIRVRQEAIDGSVLESLITMLFGTDLRLEWAVTFEPEDLDAAVELLDELHRVHPEPVERGAYETAVARVAAFEQAVDRAKVAEA